MGKQIKRGTKGIAAQYVGRSKAISRLQLSLADFRRLCILKGVYPREPRKKLKHSDRVYYHTKDIRFLSQEPLINKFRAQKAFAKKIVKAVGRHEYSIARDLKRREPTYTLHHLLRERYPTFLEAVNDLDDCLSSLALFAALPANLEKEIPQEVVQETAELVDHFHLYCVETGAIRKVFVSIKGYYFQAEIMGVTVTWLIPHAFCQVLAKQVDYKVLLTFLEFYRCLGKFVNFKLYQLAGRSYPPKNNTSMAKLGMRFLAMSCVDLKNRAVGQSDVSEGTSGCISRDSTVSESACPGEGNGGSEECVGDTSSKSGVSDEGLNKGLSVKEAAEHMEPVASETEVTESIESEQQKFVEQEVSRFMSCTKEARKLKSLFKSTVVFLSREVPRIPLVLIIRSCGGHVGWQDECSPVQEVDPSITHHVVDRPVEHLRKATSPADGNLLPREYVQPQWVFDSLNSQMLLPIAPYKPGAILPPHLSPFVDDKAVGYVPKQRGVLEGLKTETKAEEEEDRLKTIDVESKVDLGDIAVEDEEKAGDLEITELEAAEFEREIHAEAAAANEDDGRRGPIDTPAPGGSASTLEEKLSLKRQRIAEEERGRRKAMMPKKHKRLLERIEFGNRRKEQEAKRLTERRK